MELTKGKNVYAHKKSPFSIRPNTKEGFIVYFPSIGNVAKAATFNKSRKCIEIPRWP
ncbi:hypothetical protein SD074_25410 [Prolixibacter sp. SD074]|nr:hypothetical protein SD074_25410 [Prolixibacter sp. SD074]